MMNSTVDAKTFYKALSTAQKIAQRSVVPQLEEVKADFFPDRCALTASDLEQWASVEIPVIQGDSFSFVFRYTKELVKMCRFMSGALEISYDAKEGVETVSIRCQNRHSTLGAYPEDCFPRCPAVEPVNTYTADAKVLLKRVTAVRYASDVKSDREAMRGVRFYGNQIFCVDGQRVALSVDQELCAEIPFVLPVSTFKHWESLFPEGPVTLEIGNKYARLTGCGVTQVVRLLTPDSLIPKNLFPNTYRERYLLSPKALGNELAYLSEFIKTPNHQPVVFARGRLSVETNAGALATELDFGGDSELEIAFNVRHLLEVLKHFEHYEQVSLELTSSYIPIVLQADANNKALVLTMRPVKKQQAA